MSETPDPQPLRRRKIRTFRSTNGLWYFHIQADNNEVIAPSEGYKNKGDMLKTLARYFPDWEVAEEQAKEQEEETTDLESVNVEEPQSEGEGHA